MLRLATHSISRVDRCGAEKVRENSRGVSRNGADSLVYHDLGLAMYGCSVVSRHPELISAGKVERKGMEIF